MTDSFPGYTVPVSETGITEGDSYYAGNYRYVWKQPDPSNDGGYWKPEELTNPATLAESIAEISARLLAIETALNIPSSDP